jgi:hypothetical protein
MEPIHIWNREIGGAHVQENRIVGNGVGNSGNAERRTSESAEHGATSSHRGSTEHPRWEANTSSGNSVSDKPTDSGGL